eukprot:gene5436-biopygen9184
MKAFRLEQYPMADAMPYSALACPEAPIAYSQRRVSSGARRRGSARRAPRWSSALAMIVPAPQGGGAAQREVLKVKYCGCADPQVCAGTRQRRSAMGEIP